MRRCDDTPLNVDRRIVRLLSGDNSSSRGRKLMSRHYAGIERVDPTQLKAQHALTRALWAKLIEDGLRKGSTGRIESFFYADDQSAAASLARTFSSGEWLTDVSRADDTSEE